MLLNRWLGRCGYYAGLLTWRWYRIYRSLVRAKVCALRLGQQALDASESVLLHHDLERYLIGASRATATPAPALVITHGVSGSGKSHRARQLCQRQGWIQLRSDVERKRLFGLWGQGAAPSLQGDPYRPEVSALLYDQHLPEQAGRILAAGMSVVVDATFLRRGQRQRMAELARQRGVKFLILACISSKAQAQRRLVERQACGGDPSDADGAVLEAQFRTVEPLDCHERSRCLEVAATMTPQNLVTAVAERL